MQKEGLNNYVKLTGARDANHNLLSLSYISIHTGLTFYCPVRVICTGRCLLVGRVYNHWENFWMIPSIYPYDKDLYIGDAIEPQIYMARR